MFGNDHRDSQSIDPKKWKIAILVQTTAFHWFESNKNIRMNNFQNENDTKQRKPFINSIWICQKIYSLMQNENFNNWILITFDQRWKCHFGNFLFVMSHSKIFTTGFIYLHLGWNLIYGIYFFPLMVLSYGHVFFHFDWHFWASCVIRIFVWKRGIPLKPKSLIKSNRKTFYVRYKSCVSKCSEERNIISGKGVTKLFLWIIKKKDIHSIEFSPNFDRITIQISFGSLKLFGFKIVILLYSQSIELNVIQNMLYAPCSCFLKI